VLKVLGAAINQGWVGRLGSGEGEPLLQAGEEVLGDGFAGLDLDRYNPAAVSDVAPLDEEIHFDAVAVPPEIELRPLAAIEERLRQLRDNKGLEDRPPQRMGVHLFRGLDAQKPGDQPGVVKVELGGLHQALVPVCVMRPKLKRNVACLQHGHPGLGRVVGDAAVRGERRKVQNLPCSSGTQAHKSLEGLQILNFEDLTNVPFEVGGHVSAEPRPDADLPIVERRIASRVKHLIDPVRRLAGVRELAQRKGKQLHEGGPSRERLGDARQQPELLGAGKDVQPHASVGIDGGLKIRKDLRTALHLVEHGAIGKARQKRTGVVLGGKPDIRVLQRCVRLVRKNGLGERGLPGLPGPGDGHNGKSLEQRMNGVLSVTAYHVGYGALYYANCQSLLQSE